MKTTKFISLNEHRVFLFFIFISFILSVLCLSCFVIEKYNESVVSAQLQKLTGFAVYSFEPTHPRFLVLSVTTLCFGIASILLFKFCTYLITLFLNILNILAFVCWLNFTTMIISSFEDLNSVRSMDFILYQASFFDLSLFFLIISLLFWQSSILLRMLIKNIQRKNSLP